MLRATVSLYVIISVISYIENFFFSITLISFFLSYIFRFKYYIFTKFDFILLYVCDSVMFVSHYKIISNRDVNYVCVSVC